MSGTNWNAFDLNAMWAMIKDENACHGADRVMAWDGLADVVLAQKARLEKAKASLEMAWPPSKNASAAAFVAEIDKLLASMDETLQRAQDTRASLGGVVEALAKAQDQLRPLVKQRQEASTDLVPRFMDNAEDEIDRKARQIMGEAEAAVSDYATRFQPPAPFTIEPQIGGFREVPTPRGGPSYSAGAGAGSGGGSAATNFGDADEAFGDFGRGPGGLGSGGASWTAIPNPVPVPHNAPWQLPEYDFVVSDTTGAFASAEERNTAEWSGGLGRSTNSEVIGITAEHAHPRPGSPAPPGANVNNDVLGLAGATSAPLPSPLGPTDYGSAAPVRPALETHFSGPVIGSVGTGGVGAGRSGGISAARASGGATARQPVPARSALPSGMVIGGSAPAGPAQPGASPGVISSASQPATFGRGRSGPSAAVQGALGSVSSQPRPGQERPDLPAGGDPDIVWGVQEGVAPIIEPNRPNVRHDPGPGVIGWDR